MTPLPRFTVAVVMPTRNQAHFVEASVRSVLSQNIQGLRLVVQDGASDDDTRNVLTRLAGSSSAIDWRSEPDDGPADALNRAFTRALADPELQYFGWLNSDDLYPLGALARGLSLLERHPELVAVYGEGEHVDLDGRSLGRYPTRRPDIPLSAWADGCPICQPTMLLRRQAVEALLPLDPTLRAAFDYEAWLRLFKTFPGRIGFLPRVQAQSRLHADGITLRMREHVAMEAMEVLHRHLGAAPPHWLLSHAGEAFAACPLAADPAAIQDRLTVLAARARAWMNASDGDLLDRKLKSLLAWQWADLGLTANLHADGWAGPELELRLRQPTGAATPISLLRLHGRHAWPRPGRLRLRVDARHEDRRLSTAAAWWRRRFVLDIPVPAEARQPGARASFQIRAEADFVPAALVSGSSDQRALAFLVERLEALPTR